MIIISCVDDDMGMMFNHRRQSQDRVLRERVLEATKGKKLWMNHYSAKQFSEIKTIASYLRLEMVNIALLRIATLPLTYGGSKRLSCIDGIGGIHQIKHFQLTSA